MSLVISRSIYSTVGSLPGFVLCFSFISEPYPESCISTYNCYSNSDAKLMADCTGSGVTEVPQSLPDSIDWLYLAQNKIRIFNDKITTFPQLTQLI